MSDWKQDLPVESQPVKWYVLIREMEEFRERTGWGLAATWGLVHAGDYETARKHFDQCLRERWGERSAARRAARITQKV